LFCAKKTSQTNKPTFLNDWFTYTEKKTIPNNICSPSTHLFCNYKNLTTLPSLPANLTHLICYGNQLTTLPELPTTLLQLYCNNNQLTSLPELPTTLLYLYCSKNQLTTLPELPTTLNLLSCDLNLYNKYQSFDLHEIRKKQAEEFNWFLK